MVSSCYMLFSPLPTPGPHFEESGNQHERTESPNTNVDDTSDVKSGDECLTQSK